jgi:hypothetical protein
MQLSRTVPLSLLLLQLAACRFTPDQVRWIEAHGDATVREIAASPRGVEAVGTNGRIYRSPGAWAKPWVERFDIPSTQVAASPRATYFVDTEGVLWRGGVGKPVRWKSSAAWGIADLAVTEADDIYVISSGRVGRVQAQTLTLLPCATVVSALAASVEGVYAVTVDKQLLRMDQSESGCQAVDVPGPVTSVAAYGDRLAVVSRGVAHVRRDGRWQALPDPVLYREERGQQTFKLASVAMSRNTLWARDEEGHVFMLSDPP